MAFSWLVSDSMGSLQSAYNADFEANYVEAVTTPHPKNNAKLMQMFQDAFWNEINTAMDALDTNAHLLTMVGGSLDNFGRFYSVLRRPSESDAAYRTRIATKLQSYLLDTNPDTILNLMSTILNTSADQIELIENKPAAMDAGPYTEARFAVRFSLDLLGAIGIPVSGYAAAITNIQATLDDIAAAGVQIEVLVAGGAEWDTAIYDNDEPFGA